MQKVSSNIERIGNFTSSEIVALTKAAGSVKTYVDECNMERRLCRSLSCESNARPLSWGKFIEQRAFDLLGLEYKISSQETFVHPEFDYWSGSPDGFKFDEGKTVFDIKSPITLKSFCQLADCKTIAEVRENHKDGDKYYWQLVSNAIISGCTFAELIVYVPYKSELAAIREMASNYDGDQNKIAFINWSNDDELPHLVDGGYYKNLNIIRFEVSEFEKNYLTYCVKAAGLLLDKRVQTLTNETV